MITNLLSYKEITKTGTYVLQGKPVFVIAGCIAVMDSKSKTTTIMDQLGFDLFYLRLNQRICVIDDRIKPT